MSDGIMELNRVDEPPTGLGILLRLRDLDWQWSAAAEQIGPAHGARDRMIAADIVLQELETTAAQAGLLLADALAGRAPEVAVLLREWLQVGAPPATSEPESIVDQALEPAPIVEVAQPLAVADGSTQAHQANAAPVADLEPAVPAPPQPKQPPVTVTAETALALQARLYGGGGVALRGVDIHRQHQALEKLRKILGGVPPRLARRDGVLSQLRLAELALAEAKAWLQLSASGRRMMTEAIAARMRAVQDERNHVADERAGDNAAGRSAEVIRNLRNLTRDCELDRVAWGLAHKHEARFGTWLDDARIIQMELEQELGIGNSPPPFNADDAFRRLREDISGLTPAQLRERLTVMLDNNVADTEKRFVSLLEARLPDLASEPKLKRLVRRVADALEADDSEDERAPTAADPNWPGLQHTRGRRAVIVGGDGREERAPMLRDAFQFAELDWPDTPKGSPGKASALVEQVRGRRYDIVICLQRFISHAMTDQLFGLDVPGVHVALAKGYGLQQIRLALDRYLPRLA